MNRAHARGGTGWRQAFSRIKTPSTAQLSGKTMNMKFVSPEPAKESAQDVIKNTFFWPEIRPADYRASVRTDGTVTPERLRSALLTAISEVNAELYTFREKQMARGLETLEQVPAEKIDGESERVRLYRCAVFGWAKASLIERYRDFDSTGEGNKKADELETSLGDVWRDVRWALSRLRDLPHMTVELI